MPVKPSDNEEQYMLEQELRLRLQKAAEEQKHMAAAERKHLKELHWMHCPKCGHKLAVEKYGTVEVDVCPACKGIWLDANELDTIIKSKNKLFGSFLKILGGK